MPLYLPSGAPVNAAYLVTTADSSLSAEIVIPGQAASADIKGAAGAGTSREFESGDTAPTWSNTPTTDIGTTFASHLYVQAADATLRFATYAWSPSGAFDARCKINGIAGSTGSPYIGLMIGNSGHTDRVILLIQTTVSGFGAVKAFTFTSSAYTQRGATATTIPTAGPVWLRITRDGSNNVSFYFSSNGMIWQFIATQAFSFTVAELGFEFAPTNETRLAIDWLRTDV